MESERRKDERRQAGQCQKECVARRLRDGALQNDLIRRGGDAGENLRAYAKDDPIHGMNTCSLRFFLRSDNFRVSKRAWPDRARMRLVINGDEPETGPKSFIPLKVVEKRPVEVSAYKSALGNRP